MRRVPNPTAWAFYAGFLAGCVVAGILGGAAAVITALSGAA